MSDYSDYKDVWVYLQMEGGSLSKESLEALAAGRKVADKLGQKLIGVLLGPATKNALKQAIVYGASKVIYCDDESLSPYLNLRYIDVLTELAAKRKPYVFIFVENELGRDIAPRVAYRMNTGLATGTIELDIGEFFNALEKKKYEKLLVQIRPDFGTRIAKIFTPTRRPQMATIRPGNFAPLEPDMKKRGSYEKYKYEGGQQSYPAVVQEMKELPRPKVDLRDARVIISLGLGILKDGKGNTRDPKEAYGYAVKLKDAIRARYNLKVELGASRALLYANIKELEGLLTHDNQVGQTGATVAPDVYFAIGISGSVQHRVGMQKSKKIVAVNTDPGAPIFKIAHYPIVEDLYEFMPKMISMLTEGAEVKKVAA